jgi:hypothetical protein
MDQQMGDFLELCVLGDVQDVVAAIMQVVAGAPDGAKRGVAGGDARQRDGLLRLETGLGFAHGLILLNSYAW